MNSLLDFTSYKDAQEHFSRSAVRALFDGGRDERDSFNIAHECIDRRAASKKAAIRVLNADDSESSLDFGELSKLSSQLAHWLTANGVEPGERVAIMLPPGPAFYACVFGTLKVGAVVVPLFTVFGTQAFAERLQDSAPRILFTEEEFVPGASHAGAMPGVRTVVADETFLQSLSELSGSFPPQTAGGDEAVHLYTSGTTRERPSAVKYTHGALRLLVPSVLYGEGLRPGDTLFCSSSPAWGHGFWYGTIAPLAFGITACTMAGKFKPERMMHAMKLFDANTLATAPTVFRMLMKSELRWNGAPLRKISFSGEAIDALTARWVEQMFGTPPCSMYGTTEVGVVLGNYPGAADYTVKPGALGKPFPGMRLEIQDANGHRCPVGQTGEIKIWRGGRWLATRDRGHLDEDGYFFHDGRADDVIISAGWTMSAVEIEDALRHHDQVREAAVIGVPDQLRGQVPKAFVVPQQTGDEALAAVLQEFVRARLGAHEFPRIIEFVSDIPMTPAGKINRKALRARPAPGETGTSS